ncbi:ROK family transcriptional regulator [Secundilactobacillus paracollinoides]|uniref:ROK family transcriptional regulator n=1 Tax=Secundilactobacillus paracollinoides TaxID=240427 RepID=UPI000B258212|nr:ROK family transcriptional regulator [Secundilactobacillus paracollinoides]
MSSNMQSIQQSNYSDIYHLLYAHDKLSKQDIADELGLSLPTVSTNLQKLINQQLVMKNGQLKSLIGRRATAYSIDPNVGLSIGVELYRTNATIAIINLRNDILALHTVNIPFANDTEYCEVLSQQLLQLIRNKGLSLNQITGAGIGIQGLISNDGTTVLYGKILGGTGMKTSDFSQYLPFPVTFYHDADCVAVAEFAGTPTDGIFLSINEHIGTAIIINGQVLKSTSGRDGTMEHITLNAVDGPVCYCGRRGCIETYCSLSSLLQPNETLASFFSDLHQKKKAVVKRFETYLDYLADAIYNLHMFIDTPLIIAGELTKYLNETIYDALKKRLKERSVFPENEEYLRFGKVGDHSVAIGAAIPAINDLLADI